MLFTAPSGREKHLVATDHLESDFLRTLRIDDLFDVAVRERLHFDQARQTGIVFHMMGTLTELGRIGLILVGAYDDPQAGIFSETISGLPIRRRWSCRPS